MIERLFFSAEKNDYQSTHQIVATTFREGDKHVWASLNQNLTPLNVNR
jgi:hypothetical protein